jgi:hypothetical protein
MLKACQSQWHCSVTVTPNLKRWRNCQRKTSLIGLNRSAEEQPSLPVVPTGMRIFVPAKALTPTLTTTSTGMAASAPCELTRATWRCWSPARLPIPGDSDSRLCAQLGACQCAPHACSNPVISISRLPVPTAAFAASNLNLKVLLGKPALQIYFSN